MHHTRSTIPVRPAAVALAATLAALLLAACGSASHSSSSSASTSASTSASGRASTGTRTTPQPLSRSSALVECLKRNGVTAPLSSGALAKLTPAQRAKLRAALRSCGAESRAKRLSSPGYKQRLLRFTACMRSNGVHLAAPNLSGKGPIFNTSALDIASPQFRAALARCRSALQPPLTPPAAGSSR
jgi:hypothetical protein